VIHFDFDERYHDEAVVGTAISRREGVLLSIIFHGLVAAAFIIGPRLPIFQPSPEELQRRQAELERQREEASRRLVFVQPLTDIPALRPPDRAELSDLDRQAQDPVIAREPENPLPFSRGNSPERVEAAEPERARGADEPESPPQPEPESQLARVLPPADTGTRRPPESTTPPRLRGSLGDALRNLQQYVQNETFNNPQGGLTDPGATIQFDTKGVEFGPWLRRFIAQVRRNWFVPYAAMSMRGRVVITFNVHRNGALTDVTVVRPSEIESFNTAAVNALLASNPTAPLPPEYPDEKALFTVTFYYNESPQ